MRIYVSAQTNELSDYHLCATGHSVATGGAANVGTVSYCLPEAYSKLSI